MKANRKKALELYKEAKSLYERGQNVASYDLCNQIINTDPSFWKGYNLKGNCQAKLKHYEVAFDLFTQALKLAPVKDKWIPLTGLGSVSHSLGKYVEALKYLKEALIIRPDNPNLLYGIGSALWYINGGMNQEIIEYWTKATELNPKYLENVFVSGALPLLVKEKILEREKIKKQRKEKAQNSNPFPLLLAMGAGLLLVKGKTNSIVSRKHQYD